MTASFQFRCKECVMQRRIKYVCKEHGKFSVWTDTDTIPSHIPCPECGVSCYKSGGSLIASGRDSIEELDVDRFVGKRAEKAWAQSEVRSYYKGTKKGAKGVARTETPVTEKSGDFNYVPV